MNSNSRLTTTKPRSGRTPFSVGRSATIKTPVISSASPAKTEVNNILTAKQKLDLLDRIISKDGEHRRDAFDTWIQTIDSDEEASSSEVNPSEANQSPSSDGVAKNLQSNFDNLVGDSCIGSDEALELPDCVKKIREAMAINSEWTKLRKEKLDAEHKAESSELLKFDAMVTEMEKNVIPALNKLFKEPTRFHDLIRKDPPLNSVQCNIEDQKKLLANLTRLSDDCRQLSNLEISANDLDKEFEFLGELANLVDSKMHTKAAEKLKLHNMEKLLLQKTSGPDEIIKGESMKSI